MLSIMCQVTHHRFKLLRVWSCGTGEELSMKVSLHSIDLDVQMCGGGKREEREIFEEGELLGCWSKPTSLFLSLCAALSLHRFTSVLTDQRIPARPVCRSCSHILCNLLQGRGLLHIPTTLASHNIHVCSIWRTALMHACYTHTHKCAGSGNLSKSMV